MKTNRFRFCFLGPLLIWSGVFTNGTAEAQVNSWANPQSGTWNWATAANWSLGVAPSINQSAIFITNAVIAPPTEHFRSITIDNTTVNQPATLTVSNVTVSAPKIGLNDNFNTLFLNTGGSATPLHILNSLLGSLIISNGGTVSITNSVLLVDGVVYDDGFILLNTGTLITTDAVKVGRQGFGQMNVLDGTWLAGLVSVGDYVGAQGNLTLAGGTNMLGVLDIGVIRGATGVVSVTGGLLITTNGYTYVGDAAYGKMTVSGGTWLAGDVGVGALFFDDGAGQGTLTVAGGTTIINVLGIALAKNTTGTVWVTGGQLTTTNAPTYVGPTGVGRMTVSNGTWRAGDVIVGQVYFVPSQGGTLTVAGGTTTISSSLIVGDCALEVPGVVRVSDGTLYVTNASHTAFIDVRNGTFTLSGIGSVIVDVMVMTNACSEFVRAGGLFTYRTAILDPDMDADGDFLPNGWEQMHGLDPFNPFGDNGPFGDPDGDGYDNYDEYLAGSDPQDPLSTPLQITSPFHFTSILRSANNIVLTWTTPAGTTNQVQVTGGIGGSYSTNGFTNLSGQMFIGGAGIVSTNYLDTGGATNKPARYYRVRLVP